MRIGVVGLNARVERVVLPGLDRSPRATVAAVCSRDRAKAEQFAAAYPGCRAFASYPEMVGSGLVDAVFVLTPPAQHADMSLAALEAGLEVCCEKPLATSMDDAQAMAATAARLGRRTAVNFTYRSTTAHRLMAREIASPGIGRLHGLAVAYRQGRALWEERSRRETLFDLGSHAVDALLWWAELAGAGAPSGVAALSTAPAEPPAVNPGARLSWELLIGLGGGTIATLSASRVSAGTGNAMDALAEGSDGALRLTFDTDRHAVSRAGASREETWRELPVPPDLELDYAAFPGFHFDRIVGALRGEERFPDFAHGARVQAVLEAAARSEGGLVALAG